MQNEENGYSCHEQDSDLQPCCMEAHDKVFHSNYHIMGDYNSPINIKKDLMYESMCEDMLERGNLHSISKCKNDLQAIKGYLNSELYRNMRVLLHPCVSHSCNKSINKDITSTFLDIYSALTFKQS